jgi:hypothetical protein
MTKLLAPLIAALLLVLVIAAHPVILAAAVALAAIVTAGIWGLIVLRLIGHLHPARP